MSIEFEARLIKIGKRLIIKIPLNLSEKLPSRGMVMVEGTINNVNFTAPLEPDGSGSHWLEVGNLLIKKEELEPGKVLSLEIELIDEWFEPQVPKDLMEAIINDNLLDQWNLITTKAKWDWIRWIRFTANPETRNKRIQVACSKLKKGDKRPCCFDRTRCTITDVSKSGVLLDQ